LRKEWLGACALLAPGLALLLVPYPLLRWSGAGLLGLFLLVCPTLLFRARRAREILKEEVRRFRGGVLCRRGVLVGGELLDLSALGTSLTRLELTEDALVFEYLFIARGGRRQRGSLSLPILPEERQRAKEALKGFGPQATAAAEGAPEEAGQNTPQKRGGNDDGA
jgi:hypothetical protein